MIDKVEETGVRRDKYTYLALSTGAGSSPIVRVWRLMLAKMLAKILARSLGLTDGKETPSRIRQTESPSNRY